MPSRDTVGWLKQDISQHLSRLPANLRAWAEAHLVEPHRVELSVRPDGTGAGTFWIVTDHIGTDDAPCRIVFDGIEYGFEVTLENGSSVFAGRAGTFVEAVQAL